MESTGTRSGSLRMHQSKPQGSMHTIFRHSALPEMQQLHAHKPHQAFPCVLSMSTDRILPLSKCLSPQNYRPQLHDHFQLQRM